MSTHATVSHSHHAIEEQVIEAETPIRLVLDSPQGHRWRVTMNEDGNLSINLSKAPFPHSEGIATIHQSGNACRVVVG